MDSSPPPPRLRAPMGANNISCHDRNLLQPRPWLLGARPSTRTAPARRLDGHRHHPQCGKGHPCWKNPGVRPLDLGQRRHRIRPRGGHPSPQLGSAPEGGATRWLAAARGAIRGTPRPHLRVAGLPLHPPASTADPRRRLGRRGHARSHSLHPAPAADPRGGGSLNGLTLAARNRDLPRSTFFRLAGIHGPGRGPRSEKVRLRPPPAAFGQSSGQVFSRHPRSTTSALALHASMERPDHRAAVYKRLRRRPAPPEDVMPDAAPICSRGPVPPAIPYGRSPTLSPMARRASYGRIEAGEKSTG